MNQLNNKDNNSVKTKEEMSNKDTDKSKNNIYNLNNSPTKLQNPNSASKMELK